MKGVVVYNNSFRDRLVLDHIGMFNQAFLARGVRIYENHSFTVGYGKGFEFARPDADFVLFYDKDVKCAYSLEKSGYRVFNSARSIEICDNKQLTYEYLCRDVPIIKTIAAPLVYDKNHKVEEEFLDLIEDSLRYPVVVKKSFGSQGKQVFLIKTRDELYRCREQLMTEPHLYQQFVNTSNGRDLRVYVLGDRAVCAVERKNSEDFRTNTGYNTKMSLITLPQEAKDIALRSAALIGADFCAVDLLFGSNGFLVCEVNSNMFFRTIFMQFGINFAEHIADYIIEKVSVS